MKIKTKVTIAPEVELRILECALGCGWIDTGMGSFRDCASWAKRHTLEEHPMAYADSLERVKSGLDGPDEYWEDSFRLYTERRFTVTGGE